MNPLTIVRILSKPEHAIAKVLSFSLDDVSYVVGRVGKPKAVGGKGVTWGCTCPHWVNRLSQQPGQPPCKHLMAVFRVVREAKTDHGGKVVLPKGLHIFFTAFGEHVCGVEQHNLYKHLSRAV